MTVPWTPLSRDVVNLKVVKASGLVRFAFHWVQKNCRPFARLSFREFIFGSLLGVLLKRVLLRACSEAWRMK